MYSGGNTGHRKVRVYCSRDAKTKEGIEINSTMAKEIRVSIQVLRFRAAAVPAIRPRGIEINRDRWVDAHWEQPDGQESSRNVYEALLQLFTEDRVGMLADVAVALADMKVAILHVNSQKRTNGRCIISLKISCKNIEHYNSIVARLRSLNGVDSVSRGFS